MDFQPRMCYNSLVSGNQLNIANVAQLVEQLIRNQQVRGSSPLIGSIYRGVAQFGSAFGSGPKGRRFKSCHLDQLKSLANQRFAGLFLYSKTALTAFLTAIRGN